MKPSEKSSGGSRLMEPLYMVESQLKTLMAEGMATTKVRKEKSSTALSLMPLVNMWCAHTSDPAKAMARLEKAIML